MNRRRWLRVAGGATGGGLAAAAGAGIYGGLVEPGLVEFTRHRVGPAEGSGGRRFRFAQLSDLHLRGLGRAHETIGAELADMRLDFLVLTGDSVDDPAALPILDELLSGLPRVPKYAILGNWEHWGGIDPARLSAVLERWGGRLLVNESVVHGDEGGIRISGLDDLLGGRPDPTAALAGDAAGLPTLLLAHCPPQRDRLPQEPGVDLVLGGHTHGGQIRLLGAAPFRPPASGDYVAGWYRGRRPPLYVSRGIGMSVIPVRIGARPEVAAFEWQT